MLQVNFWNVDKNDQLLCLLRVAFELHEVWKILFVGFQHLCFQNSLESGYNLRKPTDYPDVQELNVPGYPRFTTKLYNQTVWESDAITFACHIDGKPGTTSNAYKFISKN